MTIVEMALGALAGSVANKLVDGVEALHDNTKTLIINEGILGGIEPELIVTPVNPESALSGDSYEDTQRTKYLNLDDACGWGGMLRLRFSVHNPSKHVIEIIAIDPGKTPIEATRLYAVMFPAQGMAHGDVQRFRCNLDSQIPSMQQFRLEYPKPIFTSDRNYFSEGRVSIAPGTTECFSIMYTAEEHAYEIKPYLAIEAQGHRTTEAVPLTRRALIYPTNNIAQDYLFVRSYDPDPPFIRKDPDALRFGEFDYWSTR